jgi:hypothetical protein
MKSFRSFFRPAILCSATALVGLGAGGCAGDTASSSNNVTDLAQSSVKNQSIGNCWIYASIGWAESLHKRYTSREVNLSESYITYWHWFEQISGGAPGQKPIVKTIEEDELKTGGWWGVAGEIMLRYGIMYEADFIESEGDDPRSARQSQAKSRINASLKSGVLSDPEQRKNPEVVRDELNKAWDLDDGVITQLDEAFGKDVAQTLYTSSPASSSSIMTLDSFAVGRTPSGTTVTLADAIGTTRYSNTYIYRRGTYAWQVTKYPESAGERRQLQIEVQKALHGGQPVIMSWLVDFAAMKGSDFLAPPPSPGRQGGHLVILEDYQINNVPDLGTLEAGKTVLDPEVLQQALSPEASIEFFRIKNSWGSSLAPDNIDELRGYHDLHMAYLDGPVLECKEVDGVKCAEKEEATPLRKVTVPPAPFLEAANGTCDAEAYQDNCSGNILQWCDNGKLERFDCVAAEWTCGEKDGTVDCL